MTKLPCVDIVHSLPGCGGRVFNNSGLCYIAAALRKDGFDTRYHDFVGLCLKPGSGFYDFYDDLMRYTYRNSTALVGVADLSLLSEVLFPEHSDSALAATIRAQVSQALTHLEGARVVCLSFNTFTTYFTAALGVALRRRNALVLLGGPSSYYAPVANLMLHLGAADALIVGEGEISAPMALRALTHGQPPCGVSGARWVENGVVRAEPVSRPPIDTIPWPVFDGNMLGGQIPLLASRGCIRSCAYCAAPYRSGGYGCRRRSPKEVDAEMHSHAYQHSIENFVFNDDMLNSSRLWMESLMQQLSHGRFLWACLAEPCGLDGPLIERMRRAGCVGIGFGVQSFSPSLLRRMNRSTNVEGQIETIILSYRGGIHPQIDVIVGHPGETDEDHQRTLDAVEKISQETNGQVNVKFYLFHLAPGSEIDRFPERFGVAIRYANPDNFVMPLARALRAVEPYAVEWQSNVTVEQAEQRATSLLAVCRRCGTQAAILKDKTQPEKKSARVDRAREPSRLVQKALGDGMAHMLRPALVLRADSNLRMHADPGKIRVLAGPGSQSEAYVAAINSPGLGDGLRILGGEASLSPVLLASLLAAARRQMVPCTLETNGIRFSQPSFAKSIVRSGLSRATVLLLGLDRETADELGGVDGSFDLALEGARQLIAAGVSTELGIVLSNRTLDNLPKLVELATHSAPGHSGLQLIVTKLVGKEAPALPRLTLTEWSIEQLVEAAKVNQTRIVIEDRNPHLAGPDGSQI